METLTNNICPFAEMFRESLPGMPAFAAEVHKLDQVVQRLFAATPNASAQTHWIDIRCNPDNSYSLILLSRNERIFPPSKDRIAYLISHQQFTEQQSDWDMPTRSTPLADMRQFWNR